MYDPTRLELIRGKEDDRRRALAHATHRREVKENHRARDPRGPSITLASFLRRAADRLDAPCDEDRPLDKVLRAYGRPLRDRVSPPGGTPPAPRTSP